MTKIIITGGHHNAGLVIAKLLKTQGVEVSWIGHRFASRGDTHDSAEYIEVKSSGLSFYELSAGRLVPSLIELLRIPGALIQASRLLIKLKPTAILSFGGYLGGTVALAGFLQGIPVYLHEQTVVAGKANRLVAPLAKKIYLTWPASRRFFPATKSVLVGLPIRESVLKSSKLKLFARAKPVLLIMGGKQGSHHLNEFIFRHLSDLLKHFNLVHQTGTSSVTGDYDRALSLKDTLSKDNESYHPVGYLGEHEIGSYFRSVDLYLGRSGAHVTYELGLLGLQAVLVPFMHTHQAEQYQNALYLADSGLAVIIPQAKLTLPSFLAASESLTRLKSTPLDLPRNAADLLVSDLLKDLHA